MMELRSAWLSTRLLVIRDGQTIDLDRLAAGGLAAAVFPLVPPICIVTAWNPMGQEQPIESNEAANLKLLEDLDAKGLPWVHAVGEWDDRTSCEPSFAVGGLSEDEARDLGTRWAQLAVFYVTDDEVAVLDCAGAFRYVRPRGLRGHHAQETTR